MDKNRIISLSLLLYRVILFASHSFFQKRARDPKGVTNRWEESEPTEPQPAKHIQPQFIFTVEQFMAVSMSFPCLTS